jgi:hypothetical protein
MKALLQQIGAGLGTLAIATMGVFAAIDGHDSQVEPASNPTQPGPKLTPVEKRLDPTNGNKFEPGHNAGPGTGPLIFNNNRNKDNRDPNSYRPAPPGPGPGNPGGSGGPGGGHGGGGGGQGGAGGAGGGTGHSAGHGGGH